MKNRRWTDHWAFSVRLHLWLRALNDRWQMVKVWLVTPEESREEELDRLAVGWGIRSELIARRRKMSLQEARLNAVLARRRELRAIDDTQDCA